MTATITPLPPIVRTDYLDEAMRERVASLAHAHRTRFLTETARAAADDDAVAIADYLGVTIPKADPAKGSVRIQRWRWVLAQARAFHLA